MYHGTPTRTVAIINGEIIDDDTAAMREELLEKDYPRYVEWGFRVEEVILTDGPRERERLSEAQEQKRNRAESKMFDSQREFFTALMEKFSPDGAPTHIDQVAQSPDQLLSKLPEDPSERRNLLNLIAAELEETVDEDVDNDLVSAMSDFGVESPVEAAIASKKKAVPAKKASRTKK